MIESVCMMLQRQMQLHTCATDGPSQILRKKLLEAEKARKMRKDLKRNEFIVHVPESTAFHDTLPTPMVLTAAAKVAGCGPLLNFFFARGQYDESKAQERLERKIQNASATQGTVRMLSREEWDEIQEGRPRKPFESTLARPNARLRAGPVGRDDVNDWSLDVLTDALTRAEDVAKSRPK